MPPSYSPLSLATSSAPASSASPSPWAFWALGVLNNASFVIMVACAKSISEGGTALVFLSNSLPSLIVKLSAPYWFDRVSYQTRMMLSSALMVAAFVIVALFSSSHHNSSTIQMNLNMTMQLIGCAFASTQCGMGEASLLALAGKCDVGRSKKACLTAFSSGTGLAGVFGYMWKFVWNDWLGLSVRITLYLATILALLYGGVYYTCLWEVNVGTAGEIDAESTAQLNEDTSGKADRPRSSQNNTDQGDQDSCPTEEFGDEEREPSVKRIEDMTARQRFQAVLRLWPYMIPLFVVYAAEYALQAGTWTAIGFPVDDEEARDQFYEYSNWMYQVGVFFSRSSGILFTAPMSILWLMPALQTINVAYFWWVAKYQVFYNNYLLISAFYVGLLGGAVYIHGYARICADLPVEHREFALSSTSVAEGLGTVCADIVGLFLQACLYQIHNIEGAVASCPFRNP